MVGGEIQRVNEVRKYLNTSRAIQTIFADSENVAANLSRAIDAIVTHPPSDIGPVRAQLERALNLLHKDDSTKQAYGPEHADKIRLANIPDFYEKVRLQLIKEGKGIHDTNRANELMRVYQQELHEALALLGKPNYSRRVEPDYLNSTSGYTNT